MSPETCNRVSEALAAGNVWGDAALLEHAKGCETCTKELAILKKRREFRDAFPVLSSIADQSRHTRAAHSDAAEAKLRASRRHLVVMIASVIAIIAYFIQHHTEGAHRTQKEDNASNADGPPRFRISNLENAVFESKVEGGTVRASMTRGIAAFHVEHMGPEQHFLLTLPDGDLEVRGTRFVVAIEDGKTRVVDVAEGTVALRLHGHDEVLLSAGQRWPAAESGRPNLTFIRPAHRTDGGKLELVNP